jgi:hypothetical protein
MNIYDSIAFELPIGAVIMTKDGCEMRHLGDGRFISPLFAKKVPTVIEIVSDEKRLEWPTHGSIHRGELTNDPFAKVVDLMHLHRRISFMTYVDPAMYPKTELTESDMQIATGRDWHRCDLITDWNRCFGKPMPQNLQSQPVLRLVEKDNAS